LLGDEKSKVENGLLADRLVEARADQLMVGRYEGGNKAML